MNLDDPKFQSLMWYMTAGVRMKLKAHRYLNICLFISFFSMLSGCTIPRCLGGADCIGVAITDYQLVADSVSLGDSKSQVLETFSASQSWVPTDSKKPPESYRKDGSTVEIYFIRTGWVSDGLTTDDEFTPYVFTDEVLTSIGWVALGGPKTTGSPSDSPSRSTNRGANKVFLTGESPSPAAGVKYCLYSDGSRRTYPSVAACPN